MWLQGETYLLLFVFFCMALGTKIGLYVGDSIFIADEYGVVKELITIITFVSLNL